MLIKVKAGKTRLENVEYWLKKFQNFENYLRMFKFVENV